MTFTANSQLPDLFPQSLEYSTHKTQGCLPTLGSELVYTQDRTGRYVTFYWQHSQLLGLEQLNQVVNQSQGDGVFIPVDNGAYLERLHRILNTLIPEKFPCWFSCCQKLFEFELVISPVMPPLGTAATTVVVMGRLLQVVGEKLPVNGKPQEVTQVDSAVNVVGHGGRRQPYYKLVNKITRNIRRTLDLDVIWQQTVDSLGTTLGLERCIICPYQPSSSRVQVIADYHPPGRASMLGWEIDVTSERAFAQALATLEPVVMEISGYNLFHTDKILVVATCYQDQANGVIAISLKDQFDPLTDADLELAKEFADQLGTAIAHATLYKELEAARQKAEEASRLKTEFLANVSHEIRTPLNGMIGFLKLILEGMADDPQEQHQFICEAHYLSIHLLHIINDILDIAKIEAGRMELACSAVKLNDLFQDVENFVRPQAESRNLSLRMQMLPTSDEIIVHGNYQRLLQVMLNLVNNAIKFTQEGSITVSADLVMKKAEFQNQEFPGMVKVKVADTGIGVSLDKQDKLFQLFSQVDGSRTRQYGGTGLGLVISQKLIEAMGGEVHFYSLGEGLGSTVTFTVPLYQQPVLVAADVNTSPP
jgi:signal transduction histidine kinase